MKRLAFALAILPLLTACKSLTPQTAQEYRKDCKERGGQRFVTVNAPLETVIERLKIHTAKCNSFNKTFTRTEGMGGNPAPMKVHDRIYPKWQNVTADRATLTILDDSPQIINQPKGGSFMHVLDLERKGDKTVAVQYDYNVSTTWWYPYTTESLRS